MLEHVPACHVHSSAGHERKGTKLAQFVHVVAQLMGGVAS